MYDDAMRQCHPICQILTAYEELNEFVKFIAFVTHGVIGDRLSDRSDLR